MRSRSNAMGAAFVDTAVNPIRATLAPTHDAPQWRRADDRLGDFVDVHTLMVGRIQTAEAQRSYTGSWNKLGAQKEPRGLGRTGMAIATRCIESGDDLLHNDMGSACS